MVALYCFTSMFRARFLVFAKYHQLSDSRRCTHVVRSILYLWLWHGVVHGVQCFISCLPDPFFVVSLSHIWKSNRLSQVNIHDVCAKCESVCTSRLCRCVMLCIWHSRIPCTWTRILFSIVLLRRYKVHRLVHTRRVCMVYIFKFIRRADYTSLETHSRTTASIAMRNYWYEACVLFKPKKGKKRKKKWQERKKKSLENFVTDPPKWIMSPRAYNKNPLQWKNSVLKFFILYSFSVQFFFSSIFGVIEKGVAVNVRDSLNHCLVNIFRGLPFAVRVQLSTVLCESVNETND